MIITKTPYRISLVGGGTDLRAFYRHGYGAVISTGIDKFIYLAIHRYFEPKIVLKYSRTEVVSQPSEIQHPLIRECLLVCGTQGPLELTSFADIPSTGSGLGSSSAFCVGLVKALHSFATKEVSAERCAALACEVEIERLGEPIGKQDQYASAYGGLNYIRFNADESVFVEPILLAKEKKDSLQDHLVMLYTGITRNASGILSEQRKNIEEDGAKVRQLQRLLAMTETLRGELAAGNVEAVGETLHESWMLKRELASGISTGELDSLYDKARATGAVGGKILGAGGGGFFLFYCAPEKQPALLAALSALQHVPIRFEPQGARTLYYQE
jgi:D-glycero-alpha-D-manno-heptose-7-phosphate kinase